MWMQHFARHWPNLLGHCDAVSGHLLNRISALGTLAPTLHLIKLNIQVLDVIYASSSCMLSSIF